MVLAHDSVTIHHSREARGKNLKQLVTFTAENRDVYACTPGAQFNFAILEPFGTQSQEMIVPKSGRVFP